MKKTSNKGLCQTGVRVNWSHRICVLAALFLSVAFMSAQNDNSCYYRNVLAGDNLYYQQDYERALSYYLAALQCDHAESDDFLQMKIDECRRMTGDRMATVSFTSDPANAVLKIDGKKRGVTPLDVSLAPGIYQLKFTSKARHTQTVKSELKIYNGAPRPVSMNLYKSSNKHQRLRVGGHSEGLWFTIDGSYNSCVGWDLGFTFGQQPHPVIGYYFGALTRFSTHYVAGKAGIALRVFPNSIENWALTLGGGYRYVDTDFYYWNSTHNYELSIGVLRKAVDGGLSFLLECALIKKINPDSGGNKPGLDLRVGIGWGFAE